MNNTVRGKRTSLKKGWQGVTTIGLSLVSILLVSGRCDAQYGTGLITVGADGLHIPPMLVSVPLTVRPHAIPLGPRTMKAGTYELDSLPGTIVYIPLTCIGRRRCPLVLFLHPGATTPRYVVDEWHAVSDRYGMILLAPPSQDDWQLAGEQHDRQTVDAALTQVLSRFAVDPDRIALIGYSASGGGAMGLGGYRLDLFSRVILGSTDFSIATVDPHNHTTQFLLTGGIAEQAPRDLLNQANALRQAGHPVQVVLGFRNHGSQPEDWDFMGRWLQTSWASPPGGTHTTAATVVDSMPLLTADVVRRMTTFWTRFKQEPESIRTTARLAHLREVVVPIEKERASVLMMDLPALAATYLSVAADLQAAGLTAQQHEAYRVALLSARSALYATYGPVVDGPHGSMHLPGMALDMGAVFDSLDRLDSQGEAPIALQKSSVQERNMEFMRAHRELFEGLRAARMWTHP